MIVKIDGMSREVYLLKWVFFSGSFFPFRPFRFIKCPEYFLFGKHHLSYAGYYWKWASPKTLHSSAIDLGKTVSSIGQIC